MALMQQIGSQLPAAMQWIQAIAISLGSLGTAGAIIFAVYKFFRRGENDPRIQPTVTSEAVVREGTAYVMTTVSAVNVGQVDVSFESEPSGLSILKRDPGGYWKYTGLIYSVFPGQKQVQPGATLEDQIWIEVDCIKEVAIALDLTLAGKTSTQTELQTWQTIEVVSLIHGNQGGNPTLDG